MCQLEDMRIFVGVLDSRSFTAAADALGLSKQFVSRRVAALEERLGVRLLNRSTRKLDVTTLGHAYYERSPGITGAWQVSDRNEGSFAGRAKFDLDYYNNLTFVTDCSILLRTVAVVVRGTGY